ncbi:hypothetical protein H5410_025849, partial [Solanum commersonii]
GISVPDPIQSICTKWGSDPFLFGSYSRVHVQSSGSDYDIVTENFGGRLFFAGEATIRQHAATMHGAYLRNCIYEPKGISVHVPIQSICTKWGSDPFSFGSYSHATIQQHATIMHRDYLSGLRETSHISQFMKVRQNNPRKTVSKNVGPSNDVLEELFKKPDLAFGKFLFVFDPLTCDSKSLGLVRVTFGEP